ncbi:MAG: hypothetical protein R3305_10255, partial [Gammaproteobacteria bacterium]|nr:hypothetical protein [Gammaproteobacteria bacterium]
MAAIDSKYILPATVGLTVIGVVAWIGLDREPAAPVDVLPYATEYPAIGYAETEPVHPVARLAERIGDGELTIDSVPDRGYLDALLAALDIDPSSQALVYSRTSLQVGRIHPSTPRAIYFNDDTYVAWVPDARTLEIAAYDANLGPVFYTLTQPPEAPEASREFRTCLRCHDTYSLSGGGVPRFLIGSGYTGTSGELVSHEAWILTTQATPLRSRWGGWYVTGFSGEQPHLGNIVVERAEDLQALDELRILNIEDVTPVLDA